MTKDQAKSAYRRTCDIEQRLSGRLRDTILVPHFGGCMCRMHNCQVNWESGHVETDDPRDHQRLAQLAKVYNYRQRQIWDYCERLKKAFARHF